MRSILTVLDVADSQDLTTVDAVKTEIGVVGDENDGRILSLIHEASAIAAEYCGRIFGQETVRQTFWPKGGTEHIGYLTLARTPIINIDTVTIDGAAVTTYRLDDESGVLYKLDSSGYPCAWEFAKAAVVDYTGGYELIGALPFSIERATIMLVKEMWAAIGRDPRIKAEDVPGVMRVDYWVGQIGKAGQLSPDVTALLNPHRRMYV